jgi:hypothetical protein
MKTIYKTTYTFEVLSDEPIPNNMALEDVMREAYDGDFIGRMAPAQTPAVTLEGKPAADEIYAFGSDPGFFELDDNGEETD